MIESKGYKITPIDGDLVVGRNAEVGGNADIHGKARVAGSLKVEGFLDAPHIKGAAKGLFNSVEELIREYPNPRPGWFAIVLDATNKEMGILYKAENRGWVATTDEARPYEFIMDSINVFASKDEVAEVSKALNEKVDKSSIVHTTGDSAEKVMSQESISKSIVANASVFKTFDSSVPMADIALAFIKDIRIYTDTPKEISLFLLSRNGNDYNMQFSYTDEAEGVYYMQYNGPINDDCCVISGNGFLAHIYVNKDALPDGVQISNMGRKAFVLSSSCFFTGDRLLGLDTKVAENTQKIDDLKDCFTVDTVVENFSVEEDTYIDRYNGTIKNFEGYELRKYPVEEGTTISVCVEGNTIDTAAAMYAIYSDDSVMDETTLLNLGPALSPANNGKHTLNLPAGSRMLALSVWKKDTTAAYSVIESRNSVEGYVDSRVNKIIEEEEINTRIDESLGSISFGLSEKGIYVDQWDNKGNAKGEYILIPTADISGGIGFMSRGDKTYLDSLDEDDEIKVDFTESGQNILLSDVDHDIPKGVHIQIQSDTITELIGMYYNKDGEVQEQTLVDGVITKGAIFRIKNKDEIGEVTIKYTGQIAELLSRLKGISEESSASTDPFRFLGEFKSPIKDKNEDEDLHTVLNNLHSKNKSDGYEGVWRFNVQGKPSTLYNLALDYTNDKWLQGLVTIYSPNPNPDYVFGLNKKFNILYRIYENNEWSDWRSITQDNTDAIAAESARAKKVEEELRQAAVTKKRNYIHATSTEAYIISKYNNKYDIIIHFAKTLLNNLYTIKRVYLAENTNTELSTDINRKSVYQLCQQETSDMIGPVSVKTGTGGLNSWVGGNHLHLTQSSGVKTAETETFIVNADDTTIGNGRMYADKITIRVKNKIYDPNVEPVSGESILSSKLIDEFVTYTIDGGEVLVSVEHRYAKDIHVSTYYGMQSMFAQYSQIITNTLTDWKDKVDKDSSYSILKDNVTDLNRFSQKAEKDTDVFYQNTILLPYGIGKHQLVGDRKQVFVEAGSKAYHVLIKEQDIKANDVLSWMGIYSWKKPIIDNEYNYIYSYSDNNGENISVTAKQVYENKIIPVSPSLVNKVYESDGVVKVNDIIGYNIVLSTENVGSSIIRVDNGIRVATTENDGLMSSEDKVKLNASIKNVDVSPNVDDVELDLEDNTDRITHIVFPAATTEKAGVMSAKDKKALDDLGVNFDNVFTIGSKEYFTELDVIRNPQNDTITRNGNVITVTASANGSGKNRSIVLGLGTPQVGENLTIELRVRKVIINAVTGFRATGVNNMSLRKGAKSTNDGQSVASFTFVDDGEYEIWSATATGIGEALSVFITVNSHVNTTISGPLEIAIEKAETLRTELKVLPYDEIINNAVEPTIEETRFQIPAWKDCYINIGNGFVIEGHGTNNDQYSTRLIKVEDNTIYFLKEAQQYIGADTNAYVIFFDENRNRLNNQYLSSYDPYVGYGYFKTYVKDATVAYIAFSIKKTNGFKFVTLEKVNTNIPFTPLSGIASSIKIGIPVVLRRNGLLVNIVDSSGNTTIEQLYDPGYETYPSGCETFDDVIKLNHIGNAKYWRKIINSNDISGILSHPMKGKKFWSIGDSHRWKWNAKLASETGSIAGHDLLAHITNAENKVRAIDGDNSSALVTYEQKYISRIVSMAKYLVDLYKSGEAVDYIFLEYVHKYFVQEYNGKIIPPAQNYDYSGDIMTAEPFLTKAYYEYTARDFNTTTEALSYWDSNFSTIVNTFNPVSNAIIALRVKSFIQQPKFKLTGSTTSAGTFTVSFVDSEGHKYTATTSIKAGMSLNEALTEINQTNFRSSTGCLWNNRNSHSDITDGMLTYTYEGHITDDDASIKMTFDFGSTGIAKDGDWNIDENVYLLNRGFKSHDVAEWNNASKWRDVNANFDAYIWVKAAVELLQKEIPTAKIFVWTLNTESFNHDTGLTEDLVLKDNGQMVNEVVDLKYADGTLNINALYNTTRHRRMQQNLEGWEKVSKYYNLGFIPVSSENSISPANHYYFYANNDVHPNLHGEEGYMRVAEIIKQKVY